MDKVNTLLKFYKKNSISPVRQNVNDLTKHFQRRNSLYQALGIPPLAFSGNKVLEIGPGSGHNSLFVSSLKPDKYILLEPNPTGIENINQLYSNHVDLKSYVKVEKLMLEEFSPQFEFDIILCEGLLRAFTSPADALDKMISMLSPHGIIVVSTSDEVSVFPEMIRRFIINLLSRKNMSDKEKLSKFLRLFHSHLDSLSGMSRKYEDWFWDNMLNPSFVEDNFSIPDLISHLDGKYPILGLCPNFYFDWRWYKQRVGKGRIVNELILNSYWQNLHNFIDYENIYKRRDADINKELYNYCKKFKEQVRHYEQTFESSHLNACKNYLLKIIDLLPSKISSRISSAYKLIDKLNAEELSSDTAFGTLFGRGMQYVAFTKHDSWQ